jgi:hypothetical protein
MAVSVVGFSGNCDVSVVGSGSWLEETLPIGWACSGVIFCCVLTLSIDVRWQPARASAIISPPATW